MRVHEVRTAQARAKEVGSYTHKANQVAGYGGECEARKAIEERTSERNMNVTLRRALLVCVLAGSLALALALAAGAGLAEAKSLVVGPGESIQKAINAADPGDTIVVRGVHREDVVIRKNGIKLRGDDAVIEVPARAKADSPCSKAFGPEAICVLGDVNLKTGEITGPRVSDVSVSGFTIRGFTDNVIIDRRCRRSQHYCCGKPYHRQCRCRDRRC